MTQEGNKMTAEAGKTFTRIIDNFNMGSIIYLGIDYSTGVEREDKPEYYKEVDNDNNELNIN